MNVSVLPGIRIEDGAIIGMGTVVAENVPAGAIVVGGRQRQVGSRDMARFARLDREGRWFGDLAIAPERRRQFLAIATRSADCGRELSMVGGA